MSGGRAHPVWPPQGETRPIWMIGSDEKPKGRAVSPQRRQPLMATSSLEPTTEARPTNKTHFSGRSNISNCAANLTDQPTAPVDKQSIARKPIPTHFDVTQQSFLEPAYNMKVGVAVKKSKKYHYAPAPSARLW